MKKQRNRKKRLVIAVIILALLIGAGFFYVITRDGSQNAAITEEPDGRTGIKYEPATEEEKAEAEANKDKAIERMEQDSQQPSPDQMSVTPVITSWGQHQTTQALEVSAFVPGIFEDGGTCTLTLTKSGAQVQQTKSGMKNVSDTTCGVIVIERNQLSSGQWQASVSYISNAASGTSSSVPIDIK